MSWMEHYERDHKNLFTRSGRACCAVGRGQHESRWATTVSISWKIGCAPQTLNEWVKKVEVDTGQRGGITTGQAEKMKALVRKVRELRPANEILRKASAYFA